MEDERKPVIKDPKRFLPPPDDPTLRGKPKVEFVPVPEEELKSLLKRR